ncbi:MAG TPA: cytochrome c3 family protein [Thermoanaerobaculia bacterium]|nr:cytochrome c3 family protein [Thermoanaerobaculia bacterium]
MQIFHRSANTLSRFSIFGAVFLAAFALWIIYQLNRSPYATQQREAKRQPVPFSHEHHVAGLGIDCRYCHTSVETSSFAGIPPTATCMNCHKEIWTGAEMLEPVRASLRSGEALQWQRVHRLPDFVQFNHSIHVHKGIGCVSCHGRVDQMPLTWQEEPLTMAWCLECHRAPEEHVRPKEKVFDLAWEAEDQETLGPELVREYRILEKTSCSVCHY